MTANIFLALYIVVMLTQLGTLLLSIYLRQAPRSLFFSYLLLAFFISALGYLFEITAPTFEVAMLSARIQYLGIPAMGPLMILFISEYCGYPLKKSVIFILWIIPLVSFFFMQAYPLQTLYYSEVVFNTGGILPHLEITGGPLYYVFFAYQYLLSVLAAVIVAYYGKRGDAVFVRQSYYLLGAALMPFVLNIPIIAGWTTYELDGSPVFLAVSSVLLAFLIFRRGMYRVGPIVRERIVETMGDGYVLVNMQNQFIDANLAAKRILPALAGASVGAKMNKLKGIPWVDAGTGADKFEFSRENAAGIRKYYRLSETLIQRKGKDVGHSILIYDITESRKMLDEVSRLAGHDALTGLYNRRTLYSAGEEMFREKVQAGTGASLLMMDLDHFKDLNDRHGHLKGDEVLKKVAQTLEGHLREGDLLARYGGEEFCVFLPGVEEQQALQIAEALRESVGKLVFRSEQGHFHITASVGVACYKSERHPDFTVLLADADTALYTAKSRGKNCVACPQAGR